jgi:hypothetical protein
MYTLNLEYLAGVLIPVPLGKSQLHHLNACEVRCCRITRQLAVSPAARLFRRALRHLFLVLYGRQVRSTGSAAARPMRDSNPRRMASKAIALSSELMRHDAD